ncbi:MAG: hypothetical protein GC204_01495 [Chloroflexi bacterium]|nr:hypothetical protein [Chloroflexota bacterium]
MGLFPLLIIIVIVVAGAIVMMRRRQHQALVKRIMDVKTQADRAFAQPKDDQPLIDASDVYLKAVRDRDWQGGYEQMAQGLRSKAGSADALQNWIENNNLHLKNWEYDSRVAYRGIINPETGETQLDGGLLFCKATFVDDRQGRVSLALIRESGQLRVSEVKMDGRDLP